MELINGLMLDEFFGYSIRFGWVIWLVLISAVSRRVFLMWLLRIW